MGEIVVPAIHNVHEEYTVSKFVINPSVHTTAAAPELPVSGAVLWFDADQITGLSDGDSVTTWEDKSGNGDDVTQATASVKPTYKTGILNSKPVVRFDGNDLLQGAASATYTQPTMFFIVAKFDNTSNHYLTDGDDGTKRHIVMLQSSEYRIYAGATLTGTTATPDTNWHLHVGLFNTTSSEYWLDGASIGTGGVGSHSLDGLSIGASYTGGSDHLGDIAEIIVYNSDLSDVDRGLVQDYLNDKYAIY